MPQQPPLFDDQHAPASKPDPHHPSSLAISPGGQPLGPEQKQFNHWLQKIEKLKTALLETQRLHAQYLPERARRIDPLHAEVLALHGQMVLLLDRRLQTPKGLSKKMQQDMTDILLGLAENLIDQERASPEVEAIYERRAPDVAEPDDGDEAARLADMQGMLTDVLGMTFDESDAIDSPEALMEAALRQAHAQREAAEEARAARQANRKKTPRQQQLAQEALDADKAVRDIYRKLASALHPDREPDDAERARKAALMAQVNAANDRKDLLALLQLQLQIEQIDPGDVAAMADEKLRHFNRVLKDQEFSLRRELMLEQDRLRHDLELAFASSVTPRAIEAALRRQAQDLQEDIAAMKHDLAAIEQDVHLKRWVKQHVSDLNPSPDMIELAMMLRRR